MAEKCKKCGSKDLEFEFLPVTHAAGQRCKKCGEWHWYQEKGMSREEINRIHDAGDALMRQMQIDAAVRKITKGY